MKTARLLVYGIGGVIAGLLIENSALRIRQKSGKKVRALRKQAKKTIQDGLKSS